VRGARLRALAPGRPAVESRALPKFFPTEPVDASFFDSAPFRLRATFNIPRPAADVWAELTADDALNWCRIINALEWTSPRPFGVGTTRTVTSLGGTNVLHEHYFQWEEGRRQSFYVLEASGPLFRRFAEDYLVEPTGDASCRFEWTIVSEPRYPGQQLANPVNRKLLKTLFDDTAKHYGLTPTSR
jgi:hypothetical protein